MKLKWEQKTERYANGKRAFLGKWPVGSVDWDSCRPKDDLCKYRAGCNLPGIKEALGWYEHEEQAVQRVEATVKYWVSCAELHQKIRR